MKLFPLLGATRKLLDGSANCGLRPGTTYPQQSADFCSQAIVLKKSFELTHLS
jgi:hypothetical protein